VDLGLGFEGRRGAGRNVDGEGERADSTRIRSRTERGSSAATLICGTRNEDGRCVEAAQNAQHRSDRWPPPV